MTTRKFPVTFKTPKSSLPGNAIITKTVLTQYDKSHVQFKKDVDGKISGEVYMDPDILGATPNISAVNLIIFLFASDTSGNVTRMNAEYKSIADEGETLDPATLSLGTAQDVTMPVTQNERKKVTIPLTAADFDSGDRVMVQAFHEGTHANDTLASNTLCEVDGLLEVVFT